MKKMFYPFIRLSTSTALFSVCVCALLTGCASTKNEPADTQSPEQSTHKSAVSVPSGFDDYNRELTNARRREQKLMYHLDHAKSTDEIIRCKDELAKTHAEIIRLEKKRDAVAAPESEGFKSVKERSYWYGPLGVVLKLTEWILEKLYMIDHT